MFEVLDFLFFDAEVKDESIGRFEDQSLLLTAAFLAGAQKGKSRVVSLDLERKKKQIKAEI